MKPNKYNNAKIYAIRSYQTDDIYIGSTYQTLPKRLHDHKRGYKLYLYAKYGYISSFEIVKYDDCHIQLIENYPCNNREELHKKEGEYIRKMKCVNKCVAGRTRKERYEDNKDEILKYQKYYNQKNKVLISKRNKEYREKNKEKIKNLNKQWRKNNKEYRKKKYTCECGKTSLYDHKSRHEKSKKHKLFVFNLHNELNHL
jgi:hypothetical protein